MLAVIILTFICLAVQVRKKAPSHPPALPPTLLSLLALVQAFGFFGGFTMFDVALALLRESPPQQPPPQPPQQPCAVPPLATNVHVPPRPLAGAECCCHVTASILLSFIVIQKWHYVTTWYVFGFFR